MPAPLATDLEEAFDRFTVARAVSDVDAALDAVMDINSISAGMPGCSQRVRQIIDSAGA